MRVVKNMAKVIAATPILTGKDADRFVGNLNKPTTPKKKKFLKESLKLYRTIKANSELGNLQKLMMKAIIDKFIQKTL